MSRRDQVVIVGAGLTGLVTALELTEQGVDCVVLEAEARPGGRVGTFTFPDGALAEAHLEEIWEGSPAFPLLSRLGLRWREHETASSVLIDGVLHPYHRGADAAYLEQLLGPERDAFLTFHGQLSTLLGDLDTAHAEGRWTPRLERMMAISLAAFVGGAGLGPRATAWLRIVVEAETAIEWDRIAALDGVAELRPFLLDGDGRPRERNVSVVGGNERLIDALVSRLPEGTVRTGARVERVTDDGQGVTVRYRDGRGRRHAVAGHRAVVTAPVWTLPELGLDPGLLDAASRHAVAFTGAGTYVKVVLRLRERVGRLWDCQRRRSLDAAHRRRHGVRLRPRRPGRRPRPEGARRPGRGRHDAHPVHARPYSHRSPQPADRGAGDPVARPAGRPHARWLGRPAVHGDHGRGHRRPGRRSPAGRSLLAAALRPLALRRPRRRAAGAARAGADRRRQHRRQPLRRGGPRCAAHGGDDPRGLPRTGPRARARAAAPARAGRCPEMTVLEQLGDVDVVGPPTGERAKLRRELGRLDTIFFLISAMVVVDTIGAVAIGGPQAFTWLGVLFVTFFIPSALASAELGARSRRRAAPTSGCGRPSAGSPAR